MDFKLPIVNLEQRAVDFAVVHALTGVFPAEYHHTLTGMGINPYHKVSHNIPVADGRYRMLLRHLQSYANYDGAIQFHHMPDFGLSCAASALLLQALDLTDAGWKKRGLGGGTLPGAAVSPGRALGQMAEGLETGVPLEEWIKDYAKP